MLQDDFLSYTWQGNGLTGRCRMRVFETPIGHTVLFSELADNPGPSVINAASAVIRAAAAKLDISTEETLWIEHSGDFSYTGGRGGEETFSRMRLSGAGTVSFQHWPNSLALDLLGAALQE